MFPAHGNDPAVAEAMGYGKGFHALDDDTIRRFVNTRWASGKSYSEAIWGDSERVAAWVQDDMAKALARGESWRRLCDELSRRFVDVSERDVMRLVVTEGTYVSRQAQLAELAREGFAEYRVEPVGDERTCEVCSALVGKAFPVDGARVGATLPPIHPRCRCQIAPAVDDWDAWVRDQVDRRQAEITARRMTEGGEARRASAIPGNPSRDADRVRRYRQRVSELDRILSAARKRGQSAIDSLLGKLSPGQGSITTSAGAQFDGKELNVAIRLAEDGSDVSFIEASSRPGAHTPDLLRDGMPVEVKRVESESRKRLFKKMWEASAQSRDVIIDMSLETIGEADATDVAHEFLSTPLTRCLSKYEKKTGVPGGQKRIRADSVTLVLHDKVLTIRK